ncbi:MAG: ATP-binding protein [Elusimicrobia bacterium]|nr:ATP-binding protein [Elusimicrobiota bacterium]
MVYIPRTLKINQKHSVFLFGPRQTGKTQLIKNSVSFDLFIDLFRHDEFLRYAKNPSILRKEVAALNKKQPLVVIDEIQRCPDLLGEVQGLIESELRARFILTGSSARKLKNKGVNLLGGRAVTSRLHPFTCEELGDRFNLNESLRFGDIPAVCLESDQADKARLLKSYVETYFKEEIQQEALVRNIPAFARFLELAGFENGNVLNFSSLAGDAGVDAKTIRAYFQILEDTLIGFFLAPFTRSRRAKLIKHPKFFFFDCGVVCALQRTLSQELIAGTPPYGRAFEHRIVLEIKRLLDYRERDWELNFFRTADGVEVDLILAPGRDIRAVEIKSSAMPRSSDLGALKSFKRSYPEAKCFCVCQTPRSYRDNEIEFVPWQEFLSRL